MFLLRKSLIAFVLMGLIVVSLFVVTTAKTQAAIPTAGLTTFAAADPCPKHNLLGIFVPWYEYLPLEVDSTGSCAVKDFQLLPGNNETSDVPLILLSIVDNMLRLAGIAAVAFVIYGGVMYTTSQGVPEATAKAQTTILNALIGLVVSLVAIAFVTYIGKSLGLPNEGTAGKIDLTPLPLSDMNIITKIIEIVIGIVAALSFLFVTIGGIRYVLSRGEPQAVAKAKGTVLYALIGLAVVIVAQGIVLFVIGNVK